MSVEFFGVRGMGQIGGIKTINRPARVQELKAQVASGQYQPDLTRVASSLLKFLAEGA